MIVKSKLLIVLGLCFLASAVSTVVLIPFVLTAQWLVNSVGFALVGIGLLLGRRWAMWLYLVQLPVFLMAIFSPALQQAEAVTRGIAQVLIVIVGVVPLALMWLRRDRLVPTRVGALSI